MTFSQIAKLLMKSAFKMVMKLFIQPSGVHSSESFAASLIYCANHPVQQYTAVAQQFERNKVREMDNTDKRIQHKKRRNGTNSGPSPPVIRRVIETAGESDKLNSTYESSDRDVISVSGNSVKWSVSRRMQSLNIKKEREK